MPSSKLIALTLSAIRRYLFSGSFGFKASWMSTNVRENTRVPRVMRVPRWVNEKEVEKKKKKEEKEEVMVVDKAA